jgi:ATP-binding cassette subfamily B protein
MFVTGFTQTQIMGRVGQNLLFRVRGALFERLQDLPVAFFHENKAGDLISRINNDTDKLNQFFSRSLVQFAANFFVMVGTGTAMLVVFPKLGAAALLPAVGLLVFVGVTSAWVKRANKQSLRSLGGLSGEIQESLDNFRVIVAFNRRDYFRERFSQANELNYRAALRAGIANTMYVPAFGLVSNLGTLIVVAYGLHLIGAGSTMTYGLLISYLAYANRFYDPLRQMAAIWADLQTALAAWERISRVLAMHSNLPIVSDVSPVADTALLRFEGVSFAYPGGARVLREVDFALQVGKTYALVGPTGGGKSTTASLMARLYDPTEGRVRFGGQDIRSLEPAERSRRIGFILQDPFLFTGTLAENIEYGNAECADLSVEQLGDLISREGLDQLVARFPRGLETPVTANSQDISLGQKQLVAFMRAVLRHPDLLILDEATANIDTVTESLLGDVLRALPAGMTLVIIAHRLNTIANVDQILFVNAGSVVPAGSLDEAIDMLRGGVRRS